MSWKRGLAPVKLHWTVNGVEKDDVAVENVDPPLPPPPPPPKPSTLGIEAGLFGGAAGGFRNIGLGFGGGLEAMGATPLSGGSAFFGLRGALERYRQAPAQDGPTHTYSIQADLVTVGVPLGYRLRAPGALWTPYLLLEPQVIFTTSTKSDVIAGETKDTSTSLGILAALGVQIRIGSVFVFAEVGDRLAQPHRRSMGRTALDGPSLLFGGRLRF